MTANSTNSFLEAWSALVEAVRNGDVKHVSKLCHLYPSISFKVMVIGVLLAYLGIADNCRQPTYILANPLVSQEERVPLPGRAAPRARAVW